MKTTRFNLNFTTSKYLITIIKFNTKQPQDASNIIAF